MNIHSVQIERFKKLFPELPEELAIVVLMYAAGATQADIAVSGGQPSRRQVARMLNQAADMLGLGSTQAIRTVVHNRLYFALLDLLGW
jgi:ABC-type Fe3+ transport system permease subunit